MRLQVLLITLHQVALAEPQRVVSGYLGETITLPSGVDPSWQLTIIEWSIFSNITWIATSRNGKKNTERISRYKGRLSLNISTGDLTIRNLTEDDAMEYTVDLINRVNNATVNRIRLTVGQHLQKPTIKRLFSASVKGHCWMGLHCSSQEEGVDLSWQVEPRTVTAFNTSNRDGNPGSILAILNSTDKVVKFTCTSSGTGENASSAVTLKCDDDAPQPQPQQESRDRCGLYSVISVVALLVIVVILYIFKDKL
ncbi:uncharacterized protein si:cabz01074946.1 isoform X2 [Xiphias gladius]|uniref:uncharacterized protein si:cabz01074946.1 isoform X2 n=1 Tax=Xiphias gladius TaxID=8245 RepID=UPI001A983930|nr:uncharacterized protein si:cabz01074946.1 isoform X2 [Xiphias gladius]